MDRKTPMESLFSIFIKTFWWILFIYCDYNINDYNFSPIFYKEMLQWWSDFRFEFDIVSPTREIIIWNNHKIRGNGKPIYYHHYNSANIVLLNDF